MKMARRWTALGESVFIIGDWAEKEEFDLDLLDKIDRFPTQYAILSWDKNCIIFTMTNGSAEYDLEPLVHGRRSRTGHLRDGWRLTERIEG